MPWFSHLVSHQLLPSFQNIRKQETNMTKATTGDIQQTTNRSKTSVHKIMKGRADSRQI